MPKWNTWTEQYLSGITGPMKRKRVELFVRTLNLGPSDTVLDLGSEDGSYLASYYPYPQNIVLADIREEPMKRGVKRYGLKGYTLLQADGTIPVEDKSFDAVWCNSVIEHVTVPMDELHSISHADFKRRGDEHQRRFARELARIARHYFVQTPYVHFPIEAHSWLPWIQYLPQPVQWRCSKLLKKIWIKKWSSNALLFNMKRFRELFPDATLYHVERCLGMPKSLMAIRVSEVSQEKSALVRTLPDLDRKRVTTIDRVSQNER